MAMNKAPPCRPRRRRPRRLLSVGPRLRRPRRLLSVAPAPSHPSRLHFYFPEVDPKRGGSICNASSCGTARATAAPRRAAAAPRHMVSERLLLGTRLCNAFMFSERLCTSAAQALLHLLPAAAARTEKEPRKRAQQLVGAAAHKEEEEPWPCLIWF